MIISAHQPAYNPWLGYLHKILISDIFVVMDDVQYEKNSYINRNKILQNQQEIMLTIPIKTKEYKTKIIRNMEILDNNWQSKHLKSIEQSYKKAPYFKEIFFELEQIYSMKSNFLINYTNAYLDFLVKYLQIDTKIVYASTLNIESKKLDYVIELVKKVAGDCFIFGALGKDYANTQELKKNGITPYFQEYHHPTYHQLSKEFHLYMGILDLIFNEESSNIKSIILSNNITKDELRKLYV